MHYGIIAAGEGSRLLREGAGKPKPLIEIEGKPMIQRLMDIFRDAGAESISIIVNEEMKEVQQFVKALAADYPVPVRLTIKSTPSSMHSFHEVCKLIGKEGRFIVTTVDTIFKPADFRRYAEAFADAEASVDGMMAITDFVDDEKPLWVETADNGDIVNFRDEPWSEARYVSGGIYGLDGSAIEVLDDCMERGVSRMRNFQRALVGAGLHLKGYPMGKILDIDHVGDIEKAEAFLKEK